jgi:hypothetical protein
MPNQKSKCAAWQRRREEYLRAAGRYDDLGKEGYLPPDTVERWSVIAGGRGRFQRAGHEPRSYVVIRLGSTTSQAPRTSTGDAVAQHTAIGASEKILKIGQGDAFSSPGISV